MASKRMMAGRQTTSLAAPASRYDTQPARHGHGRAVEVMVPDSRGRLLRARLRALPVLGGLLPVHRSEVAADVLAGITLAAVSIPVALRQALLAEVPERFQTQFQRLLCDHVCLTFRESCWLIPAKIPGCRRQSRHPPHGI